ncbi:class I SAM-dependent methyltransferase [Halobium salinum]|uniref:Class I SAM-dependent methyltransferase n=1 Tax=Halobium salinum TaxID=1364940 RepID=A0ABD5PGU1_9EURY|nr:class I SAM-dependent methyltransferase [Halobium salinum]
MVDKDAVRRAYDEIAEVYAEERATTGRSVEILEAFLDSLSDPQRVLDAGCGHGRPVLTRMAGSTDAVGLDFSRGQLDLAREAAPAADLLQGDMTALPLDDDSVDAVVACWSLIHVPMDDHGRVVGEVARVLRPGGRVLLCEGRGEWDGANPDWLDTDVGMEWNMAGEEATRDHLREAGFRVVDRWLAPDSLEEDPESHGTLDEEDLPWVFLAGRLEA